MVPSRNPFPQIQAGHWEVVRLVATGHDNTQIKDLLGYRTLSGVERVLSIAYKALKIPEDCNKRAVLILLTVSRWMDETYGTTDTGL
jgi:hypothetical protein